MRKAKFALEKTALEKLLLSNTDLNLSSSFEILNVYVHPDPLVVYITFTDKNLSGGYEPFGGGELHIVPLKGSKNIPEMHEGL